MKDYHDVPEPKMSFQNVLSPHKFKKSASLKQLANSNFVKNTDPNFFHALKDKIKQRDAYYKNLDHESSKQ
jgi:hypothetical protein